MPDKDERSLGDLIGTLARETETLFRQEVALAKTELTDKAQTAGRNIAAVVVGGAVGYAALLALLAAAILGLATVIPAWAAALAVAVVVGIIGAALISKALATLKRVDPVPRKTVETLQEDARWAKQQVK